MATQADFAIESLEPRLEMGFWHLGWHSVWSWHWHGWFWHLGWHNIWSWHWHR